MAEKLTSYDPAAGLNSDEAIAVFMAEAFQTNDAGYVAYALGLVARAKGMAQIAVQTGLFREQLYRSFSENGNPNLKMTLAVMNALGIELTAKVPAAVQQPLVADEKTCWTREPGFDVGFLCCAASRNVFWLPHGCVSVGARRLGTVQACRTA